MTVSNFINTVCMWEGDTYTNLVIVILIGVILGGTWGAWTPSLFIICCYVNAFTFNLVLLIGNRILLLEVSVL